MMFPHIEGDAALIRHSLPDKVNGHLALRPSLVILAGNGAVEGGSLPLIKALLDSTGRSVSENASASVAAVLAQTFRGRKNFALKDLSEIFANVGSLDLYLEEYYKFKSDIAENFRQSFEFGKISLRASMPVSEQLATFSRNDVGVITSNWDQCIWESSNFDNVIQLHGIAKYPESIVLPGEYASDEDLAEILENHGLTIEDDEYRRQVLRMFRGDFMRPVNAALQTSSIWLANAKTVVVWGLGFHAYDSEICQLAWDAFNPSNVFCANRSMHRNVIIVNPSEQHREMCKHLFGCANISYAEFNE